MKIYLETLLYIIKDNKVLLILKKRGLGRGLYNGVGGKIEKGESPEKAAIRECKEEIGITPIDVEFTGLLEFWNYENNKPSSIHFVYVYRASDFGGKPKETEEAKPVWFDINKIPYNKMWEDDKFWMPLLIRNKKFYGRFIFKNWKLITGTVYEMMKASGL